MKTFDQRMIHCFHISLINDGLISFNQNNINSINTYILHVLERPYAMNIFFIMVLVGEVNFALDRPAFQSSTYGRGSAYVASKAVDGNARGFSSCSITGAGDYSPWWKVQLLHPVWVTHVEITSRRKINGLGMKLSILWSERTSSIVFDNIY